MTREEILQTLIKHPLFLVTTGSHLYGTNTEQSDLDVRGFIIPPKDYLIGLANFEQSELTENGVDQIIWSLKRYLELIRKGDPQVFEMLFAPDTKVLKTTNLAENLRSNRHKIVGQHIVKRIVGYAEAEWRKVKGVKVVPAKRTITEDQVITDIRDVFKPNKNQMDEVLSILFANHEKKVIPATGDLGTKRKQQIEQFGYCCSSASHSIRLLGQLEELLATNLITFPRPNRDELFAIKTGSIAFEQVEKRFMRLREQVETLKSTTLLREKPDHKFLEDFYREAVLARLA